MPTKLGGAKNDQSIRALIDEALDIRGDRLAGYPRKEWRMSFKGFQMLVLIEQMVSSHRMGREEENNTFLMASAGFERKQS